MHPHMQTAPRKEQAALRSAVNSSKVLRWDPSHQQVQAGHFCTTKFSAVEFSFKKKAKAVENSSDSGHLRSLTTRFMPIYSNRHATAIILY